MAHRILRSWLRIPPPVRVAIVAIPWFGFAIYGYRLKDIPSTIVVVYALITGLFLQICLLRCSTVGRSAISTLSPAERTRAAVLLSEMEDAARDAMGGRFDKAAMELSSLIGPLNHTATEGSSTPPRNLYDRVLTRSPRHDGPWRFPGPVKGPISQPRRVDSGGSQPAIGAKPYLLDAFRHFSTTSLAIRPRGETLIRLALAHALTSVLS